MSVDLQFSIDTEHRESLQH